MIWSSIGWVLIVVGLGFYLGSIGAAMLRINRQYSRAMMGGRGLRAGAGLSAAVRRSPALLLTLAGLVVLHVAT
jgi:hypothetical protein